MPSWRCRHESCPGRHGDPTETCAERWLCPRTIPPCPGHQPGEAPCSEGDGFDCGARFCSRRHRNATEACATGPWYCGQTDPMCGGHAGNGSEHRHGTGAIRLYGSMMRGRRAATGLARSVVQILRDPDLAQIRFELYGTTVNESGFAEVACQVENGTITVRPLGIGTLDGTLGDYRISVNVMEINLTNWTVSEKATIVHEAVHAMTDIHNSTSRVDRVEHEAAAFVGGAWYYRIKTGGSDRGARSEAADRVVTALQRRRAPAGADLSSLLEEVRRTYHGNYTFDGVEGAIICIRAARSGGRR